MFYLPEFLDAIPNNWFSKHHFTDCRCYMCKGSSYARRKFDWKRAMVDQDYASIQKSEVQKTWW